MLARVYYMGAVAGHSVRNAVLVLVLLLVALAPAALAQEVPPITLNPVMIKGPATAPVTIVEFADYQ
jgi:hypothetical protein